MLGPRPMALIGYLKGVQHASFSSSRKCLRAVVKLPSWRSGLARAVDQVSQALKSVHDELGEQLVTQPTLGGDETGHQDNGRQHWTWCFRAAPVSVTWFHIDPTRNSRVRK